MPGQNAVPSFENGKCKFDVPVDIEDFINEISVTYGKGAFILKGSFQERTNYHLRASTGTDMGICATINPVVSISSDQVTYLSNEIRLWYSLSPRAHDM